MTLSPARRRALTTALAETFGFAALRPGQAQAIEALLAGRNVLAVMPTGAGKSLCFQLPALLVGGLTIVVSPLVALMRDQVEALRLNGIAAATINSDRDRAANVAAWRGVQAGRVRLLYLSPERLMTDRMLAALARLPVRLIAVDEAHCISRWGPAFRPDYEALCALGARFPDVPLIGLTATADPATRNDIAGRLLGDGAVRVVTGFDRPNLALAVARKASWRRQVADFVAARAGAAGIVYCLSRRKTEDVARMLADAGHAALAFHAGMDSADKAAAQNRFMTEPGTVIVATIAFGMGIDKPDIRYVLHADLPAGPEAYYQEIGRAGRDGAPAETLMLYGLDDIRLRRTFIEEEDSDDDRRRREHRRLDALVAYCEAPACRRRALLRYFGEDIADCGNCDNCRNPVPTLDGTAEARTVLSAVHGTGARFGAAHIVDVLRGRATDKAVRFGHDRLPAFGAGAGRTAQDWRSVIRQMVAGGLLEIDIAGHGGLRPAAAGAALMRGDGAFRYRPDRAGEAPRQPALIPAAVAAPDLALLAQLKSLRLKLARELGVPAYVVFTDRTLMDMAARRPRTPEQLLAVHGVGAAKLERFAEPFLALIAADTDGAAEP